MKNPKFLIFNNATQEDWWKLSIILLELFLTYMFLEVTNIECFARGNLTGRANLLR